MRISASFALIVSAAGIAACSHTPHVTTTVTAARIADSASYQPIHFSYDSAELDEPGRVTLRRISAAMHEHPDSHLFIPGNTDEPGSRRYNLVLGAERAAAARDYLVSLGVATGRIHIRSNGETQPVVDTDQPSARNRRDDLTLAFIETPGSAAASSHVVGAGTPSASLPAATSSHDPQPEVAAPGVPAANIVKQAGVGGTTAYGRAGVLELGGSAGVTRATDFTAVSVSPSIGWYFLDDFEVSAIMGLNYAKAGGTSSTLFTALLEPSFHLPFSKTVFGFVGLGAGIGHDSAAGTGFATQPRVGANLLVGRSGVLTPALFLTYTTTGSVSTPQGRLVAVSTAVGMQVGYTVMW